MTCSRRHFSHCHYRFNSYISHWSLCYICILQCNLPFVYTYGMTMYCRRLTSYRKNIDIEKIFVCERAGKIFAFCTFQKSYFFHYFCWYLGYFFGIMTCLLVSFCYICTFNAVSSLLLAAWHYKRLTITSPGDTSILTVAGTCRWGPGGGGEGENL